MKKTLGEMLFRTWFTRAVVKKYADDFEAHMDNYHIHYDVKEMYVHGAGKIMMYSIYTVGDITPVMLIVDDYLKNT